MLFFLCYTITVYWKRFNPVCVASPRKPIISTPCWTAWTRCRQALRVCWPRSPISTRSAAKSSAWIRNWRWVEPTTLFPPIHSCVPTKSCHCDSDICWCIPRRLWFERVSLRWARKKTNTVMPPGEFRLTKECYKSKAGRFRSF